MSARKATPFRRRDGGQCFTPRHGSLWRVPLPRRLVGHAAAAQTRRVQPASLLQAHLQVRRSTRCLGQLYKSGFTELCNVIMRTNETPLAAATHKLNQLKDKAGLSDSPADDSGRPGASVDEQQPEACGGPAQQLTQQLSSSRPRSGKCLTSCSQPCHLRLVSACGASRGCAVGPVFHSVLLCVSFVCDRTVLRSAARGVRDMRNILVYKTAS